MTRRSKTLLVPSGDAELRDFIAAEAPVPVEVVTNPSAPLGPSDLAVLVVESVDPALRAAATRVLEEPVDYVVLVRRDVWSSAGAAVRKLLEEVQQDPRRKLIRFWRDRPELESALRDEVFRLDGYSLVGQSVADGMFVKVGSGFEQTWELENTGFRAWEDRSLKELGRDYLEPGVDLVPIERTEPGERVSVTVPFTAPPEPASCRSVWQIVHADGRLAFPWAPGVRCQVLAVY